MPNTIIAIFSSFLLLDQMGLAQQWGSVPLTANSQMNFMPQMVGAMPQMMAASTPQTGAGAGVGAGTGAATGGVGAATPMGPTTGAANTAATANQWNGFVNINGVALPAFIPLTPLNSTKTFKRYAHIAKQKGLPVTGEQSFLSSWASMVQWLARPTMDYLSAYTKLKLEFNFFKLPKEGSLSPAPWAGHYWPRYLDGINFMVSFFLFKKNFSLIKDLAHTNTNLLILIVGWIHVANSKICQSIQNPGRRIRTRRFDKNGHRRSRAPKRNSMPSRFAMPNGIHVC